LVVALVALRAVFLTAFLATLRVVFFATFRAVFLATLRAVFFATFLAAFFTGVSAADAVVSALSVAALPEESVAATYALSPSQHECARPCTGMGNQPPGTTLVKIRRRPPSAWSSRSTAQYRAIIPGRFNHP